MNPTPLGAASAPIAVTPDTLGQFAVIVHEGDWTMAGPRWPWRYATETEQRAAYLMAYTALVAYQTKPDLTVEDLTEALTPFWAGSRLGSERRIRAKAEKALYWLHGHTTNQPAPIEVHARLTPDDLAYVYRVSPPDAPAGTTRAVVTAVEEFLAEQLAAHRTEPGRDVTGLSEHDRDRLIQALPTEWVEQADALTDLVRVVEFALFDRSRPWYPEHPDDITIRGVTRNYYACPSHCCSAHGCKYGYQGCPVETGQVAQEYPCEFCDDRLHRVGDIEDDWDTDDNEDDEEF